MKRADFARAHLLNRSILSYLLYPASLCYAGFMHLRRKLLAGNGFRAPFKVISIGNLTSGGSGKSPIAIAICNALRDQGFQVAYASRGYKSKLENQANMVSDGKNIFYPASVAGDEAVMAAKMLPGIPVFSGRKRREVLQLAATTFPDLEIAILDDAFQHLKVNRDLDILVFDTQTALGNGFVIPAGYLRESLKAIQPGCLCLLHQKPGGEINGNLEHVLDQRGARVFRVQSKAGPVTRQGKNLDPDSLPDKPLTLLSAIAHPASFELSANALGIKFRRHLSFPDHCDFENPALQERLLNDPSPGFLVTAKDAVKLEDFLADRIFVLTMITEISPELLNAVIKLLR